MKNIFTASMISFRLWLLTVFAAVIATFTIVIIENNFELHLFGFLILGFVIAMIVTIPALIALSICVPIIHLLYISWQQKMARLIFLILAIDLGYTLLLAVIGPNIMGLYDNYWGRFFADFLIALSGLFACSLVAILFILNPIVAFFSKGEETTNTYIETIQKLFNYSQKTKTTIMDYETVPQAQPQPQQNRSSNSNSILIKAIITAVLILVMLVPTFFINRLIAERETRQQEVVKEVSSKWAEAQTLSAPYITVPYATQFTDTDGKLKNIKTELILLADKLDVKGTIFPEVRPRSIYKVLLYRSDIKFDGSFKTTWPADINMANVDLTNAKLCFSISDYKGIQEEIFINYNSEKLLLSQGTPVNDLGEVGLSVPINLNAEQLKTGIPFNMQIRLKGSEQLHFLPLSSNSTFDISSTWASPSFDGNTLPNERKYNDTGFNAKWNFTKANLPFGSVIKAGSLKASATAFGVSLVQPSDQYNKTTRSVKYAILLIGLTFAFFFIIELMQKKPLHPMQYILVGFALVIFYTLLLSISEYMLFDYAYLIAATATILLITLYAQSHFNSWKSASIFCGVLTCLYGFIFILIRLEDTALLVGSIGLFIILALVMYGSRKINWYGNNQAAENK
jgi:inner membrane protein